MLIAAPRTFPCSACSMDCAGARVTSSALTVAPAVVAVRRASEEASPVITISPSFNGCGGERHGHRVARSRHRDLPRGEADRANGESCAAGRHLDGEAACGVDPRWRGRADRGDDRVGNGHVPGLYHPPLDGASCVALLRGELRGDRW